jgi:hypothetical protein
VVAQAQIPDGHAQMAVERTHATAGGSRCGRFAGRGIQGFCHQSL